MLQSILDLLAERHEFFLNLLWQHLEISFVAIAIAIVFGGLAGILISEYQRAAKPTLAVINFLYTIPSISMLGFLIPFSGIGNATAIIALTIYALLPMVRSTHTGISNVEPALLEAAVGMGSTRLQVLRRIKLPLAMPVIMSGIRSMATMTIALAGIASFIGAGGLGIAIYRGITTNNAALTMTGSLLIAVLALVVDVLLGLAERCVGRHPRKAGATSGNPKPCWCRYALPVILALVLLGAGGSYFWRTPKPVTLHLATKPMTEQFILGEMLRVLIIQETGLPVQVTPGVGGGTANIEIGMEKGVFDLYPEYTGTGWNAVLKNKGLYTESLFNQMQAEYKEKLGLEWVGMYGFNNTFGMVVQKDIAQRYNLKTYSDLAKVAPQLTFGAEYDFFERKDGYQALCDAYNLKFKGTVDLDIGLKYQALNEKKIDVMNIFTTDGQLAAADAVVLVDDKNFYPSYKCGTVVRREILQQQPKLAAALHKLDDKITDSAMAEMNYQVETNKKEPKAVAHDFLRQAGLLKGEVQP